MSEKLLPCPFCGSCDVGLDRNDETNFDVTCWKCQAGTAITYGPEARTKEAAFTAWNTRAAMQADAAPVAWMYSHGYYGREIRIVRCDWLLNKGWTETPLYTHPPVDDRVSTSKPVVAHETPETSGKLRDAVHVWAEALAEFYHGNPMIDRTRRATAVIEADRAALVAEIVGDIRATMCDCSGKFIADEIAAKWGGE